MIECMKKLLTFAFAMLLGAGLSFAQDTGGSTSKTPKAASGKKATKESGKKATKVRKGNVKKSGPGDEDPDRKVKN